LTGQIPNFDSIEWLEEVKLSGNQLNTTNGPEGFATLPFLITLDLSNNKFSGPPPNLTTMSLQYLNLSMNKFDGPIIVESIFNIQTSNLRLLDQSQNNFSGPLPNISLFSDTLQQLDLSDNFFDPQQVPPWLSEFYQLQTLALRGCNLFGSFPYTVASLPQLQSIDLDSNNLSGALVIGSISSLIMKFPNGSNDGQLKYLIITNNHISNVEYNNSDIIDVITIIMLANNSYCLGESLQTNGQRCYCSQNCLIIFGWYFHPWQNS
jgi:hypothetical protein